MVTIAVDAMGGDHGPRVTVPAVATCLSRYPDLNILLYGQRLKLDPYLHQVSANTRLSVINAHEVIDCDEKPSTALRKRKASMRMAIEAVRDSQAHAVVSSGNTGALVTLARYVLKSLLGIDRPALVARIPNMNGHSLMLDLGANVECDTENLIQFAAMGTTLSKVLDGNRAPRVALLNIGTEEIKGNEEIRLANRLLKELGHLNYIGYIEGDEIYKGKIDVIVCNGFAGNIALKTSEGLVHYVTYVIRQAFKQNWLTRIIGLLALPILEHLKHEFNPDIKNGGILMGVQGIVVKSHGKSKQRPFEEAISTAYILAKNQLLEKVAQELDQNLG